VRIVGQTATITALVTDQYCNPKQGATVSLVALVGPENTGDSPTSSTATLTNISGGGVTGANGKVTATLGDTASEFVTVSGSFTGPVGGDPTLGTLDVQFKLGPPRITSPTNADPPTSNNKPVVSGDQGDPGATVTVTDQSGGKPYDVCTATVQEDGTWSCTSTTALPDGKNTLTATQSDGTDKSGPSNSVTITIDTTAPDKPVITSPANGDPATSNHSPTITGTANPNEVGGTITVIETTGGTSVNLCTTTVTAMGTWSCVPDDPMADGEHTITATDTDLAGNVSQNADPVTFTIDEAAPGAPRITSPVSSTTPTTDNTPTIVGDQGTPGELVTVSDTVNGSVETVCTAVVQDDNTWSCDPDDPLPDGVNT